MNQKLFKVEVDKQTFKKISSGNDFVFDFLSKECNNIVFGETVMFQCDNDVILAKPIQGMSRGATFAIEFTPVLIYEMNVLTYSQKAQTSNNAIRYDIEEERCEKTEPVFGLTMEELDMIIDIQKKYEQMIEKEQQYKQSITFLQEKIKKIENENKYYEDMFQNPKAYIKSLKDFKNSCISISMK